MFFQVSLDTSLKLYKLSSMERTLHLTRIGLAYMGLIGLVGMIISMKVFGDKAKSSMFELLMATSFLLFLASFGNQLSRVQITISASLNEDNALDFGTVCTSLEIEVSDVSDDDASSVSDGVFDFLDPIGVERSSKQRKTTNLKGSGSGAVPEEWPEEWKRAKLEQEQNVALSIGNKYREYREKEHSETATSCSRVDERGKSRTRTLSITKLTSLFSSTLSGDRNSPQRQS
jgi:hypothetical protein